MTPEQRWTRIENTLQALMEVQARHETQIDKHSAQIEKQNAGIRDLIVISRTLIESQKKTDGQIKELHDAIKALAKNVDRFLRGRGSNGRRA